MTTKRIVAKNLKPGTMVMAHLGDQSIPPFIARDVFPELRGNDLTVVRVETDTGPRLFWPTDTLIIAEGLL